MAAPEDGGRTHHAALTADVRPDRDRRPLAPDPPQIVGNGDSGGVWPKSGCVSATERPCQRLGRPSGPFVGKRAQGRLVSGRGVANDKMATRLRKETR